MIEKGDAKGNPNMDRKKNSTQLVEKLFNGAHRGAELPVEIHFFDILILFCIFI
jgi:hypothetical protein